MYKEGYTGGFEKGKWCEYNFKKQKKQLEQKQRRKNVNICCSILFFKYLFSCVRFTGAGVTDDCVPPCGYQDLNQSHLQEQHGLITSKSFLHPLFLFKIFIINFFIWFSGLCSITAFMRITYQRVGISWTHILLISL